MSELEPPRAPDTTKPSFWSVAMVLFATLLIIPGLCFGFLRLESQASMVLVGIWMLAFFAWVIVLIVKLVKFIGRRRRPVPPG